MNLWVGAVIASLAVGVIVWGLTFWCCVAYKKKSDDLPPQTKYNMPAEITFTGLPIVIIAVLFYFTATYQTDITELSDDSDLDEQVTVTALKWNWQFKYGSPDEVTVENENGQEYVEKGDSDYIPVLVVPEGKVRFNGESKDVIHSFWVPDTLFKRDVIPGRDTAWEYDFTSTGTFVGRCAELCGAYHAFMNFEMRVVSQEDFDVFISEVEGGASTPEALEAIGQEPYAQTTTPFETGREAGVEK